LADGDRSTPSRIGETETVEGTLALADMESSGPRVSMLIYHRDGAEIVPLHEGQSLVLGRARPADVAIRDGSLSRQHGRFTLVDGTIWVEDLNSTNGTLINGKKIHGRSRVKPSDDVRLGAVTVAIHVLSPDETGVQGLDSHDRVIEKLEEELQRAQTFGRKVAVLMVRAVERKRGHLSRWSQRVRQLIRPVDSIALYDSSSALVVLAEAGRDDATHFANAIILGQARGEPKLVCGIATFPESASSVNELLEVVRLAARQATARAPISIAGGATDESTTHGEDKPVVCNAQMIEIFRTAQRVAEAQSPVLIYGETGTGKEVLARAIHEGSRRRGPLRCINCAAIPAQLVESALFGHERGAFTGADRQAKGLFEEADTGSVLLDEIGELSSAAQATLLRVIETKRVCRVGSTRELGVDVRVLAATHRDLERMCEAGHFRTDLFYRLNTIVFRIPPLRDRPEEIGPLVQLFVKEANRANRCRVRQVAPEAMRLLERYGWPGNVRELRNVIERAVLIAQDETIAVDDLSERIRQRSAPAAPAARPAEEDDGTIKDKLRRYEADLLLEALEANGWNQTRTAEVLGMPLRTLVHKMSTFGLKKRFDSK
jgi:two-component system, NtrC family, response regulator AtoC